MAHAVASDLGVPMLDVERKRFGDSERYMRLSVDSRDALLGKIAVVVGALVTDGDLLEMYRIGCALVGYGSVDVCCGML
jgi:hypothetical protein